MTFLASLSPSGLAPRATEKDTEEHVRVLAGATPPALPDHELWAERPWPRASPARRRRWLSVASSLALLFMVLLLTFRVRITGRSTAPTCFSWVDLLPPPLRSPPVPPSSDDFYLAPANLSLYAPGSVLESRTVHSLLPTLQFPQAERMVQLAYATTDTRGAPTHSVATLYKPLIALSEPEPDAPSNMLVINVWEDAVSIDCCPSWALRVGGANSQSVLADTAVVIAWALTQGWYVLVPDHEGPESAFAAGWQEGAATLDAIRAGMSWAGLELNHSSVALWGYSGGGHATAWAGQRHMSYAPELPIVAAAMGGVPADLAALVSLIDAGPFAGFVAGGLAGLGAAYPDLEQWVQEHALPSLSATLSWLRSGVCLLPELTVLAGRYIQGEFTILDPLHQPLPARVLAHESLLHPLGGGGLPSPRFPRYIWHALHDEVVPFAPVAEWVDAQCASAARTQLDLDLSPTTTTQGNIAFAIYRVGGHAATQGAGLPASLTFIARALKGSLQANWTCGSDPFAPPLVKHWDSTGVLSEPSTQLWSQFNGTRTPWGPVLFPSP